METYIGRGKGWTTSCIALKSRKHKAQAEVVDATSQTQLHTYPAQREARGLARLRISLLETDCLTDERSLSK